MEVSNLPPRTRHTRRPFGSLDQRLAFPPEPGFHHHWFNDLPGRIRQAEDAGYTHVLNHDNKPMSAVVGITHGGAPLISYLMKIPQEWYEEDQASTQRRSDQIDRAIQRGQVQGAVAPADAEHFYASAQGREIRMTEGTGRRA